MMPTRLCFVVESGTDVRLVEGLAERFELTILAREIEGGVEISHPPRGLYATVGPASRFHFALFVWRKLWRQRKEIDFVLVQGYSIGALAANLMSRVTATPTGMLVCSPVEAYYLCRKAHPTPGKPFHWYELSLLQMLAHINAAIGRQYLVLSQHLASVVRAHGGRGRIDVIPVYGVDIKRFSPPVEPKAVIRTRLELPTTGTLIFFSSRIAPEKDSETLLEALQRLLDAGRDLWLLHRSGGYQAFIKEARRFGIAQWVIATDAVHPHCQLPQDYQACDICVQASREEGLGFSSLEALACGVPVIAAAVGGLKETILDGKTGWTYPTGDPKALAQCIEFVLDNPLEAARRAEAGRRLVCARYQRTYVFEQLAEMIQKETAKSS